MFNSSFFKFVFGFFLIIAASFVATFVVVPYFDADTSDVTEDQPAELADEVCDVSPC